MSAENTLVMKYASASPGKPGLATPDTSIKKKKKKKTGPLKKKSFSGLLSAKSY